VVIGTGKAKHFKEFRNITGYGGRLYCDPSRKAFSLLGFSSSLTGIVGLGTSFKALSAMKQGFRQGKIQGNTLQLGGAIVIDTSENIQYFYAGKKAGDHPKINDLLAPFEAL